MFVMKIDTTLYGSRFFRKNGIVNAEFNITMMNNEWLEVTSSFLPTDMWQKKSSITGV